MQNRLVAQRTHSAMGTVMTHKAFGLNVAYALEAVCIEIAWLEDRLSRFSPDSDVGRVNRSAGTKSEKVSRETYTLLSDALEFSRRFPACFDVTIAPLVALWNAGPGRRPLNRMPTASSGCFLWSTLKTCSWIPMA